MDFTWRSFSFASACYSWSICVELHLCRTMLLCIFMSYVLHECWDLRTWFVTCDELRWLVMLLSFMFIFVACWGCVNHVKFILYISCILYASIFTCRGNSVKIFKFHEYVLSVFIQIYMHISRESSLYSSNLGEFIHIIFWNFQEKWVSSSKVQFQIYLELFPKIVLSCWLEIFYHSKISVVINYQKGGDWKHLDP